MHTYYYYNKIYTTHWGGKIGMDKFSFLLFGTIAFIDITIFT